MYELVDMKMYFSWSLPFCCLEAGDDLQLISRSSGVMTWK